MTRAPGGAGVSLGLVSDAEAQSRDGAVWLCHWDRWLEGREAETMGCRGEGTVGLSFAWAVRMGTETAGGGRVRLGLASGEYESVARP